MLHPYFSRGAPLEKTVSTTFCEEMMKDGGMDAGVAYVRGRAAAFGGALAFFLVFGLAALVTFIGHRSGWLSNPWFQFLLLFGWAGGSVVVCMVALNHIERAKESASREESQNKELKSDALGRAP